MGKEVKLIEKTKVLVARALKPKQCWIELKIQFQNLESSEA